MNTLHRLGRLIALLDLAKGDLDELAGETDDPVEEVVEAADHLDEAVALLTKVLRS